MWHKLIYTRTICPTKKLSKAMSSSAQLQDPRTESLQYYHNSLMNPCTSRPELTKHYKVRTSLPCYAHAAVATTRLPAARSNNIGNIDLATITTNLLGMKQSSRAHTGRQHSRSRETTRITIFIQMFIQIFRLEVCN